MSRIIFSLAELYFHPIIKYDWSFRPFPSPHFFPPFESEARACDLYLFSPFYISHPHSKFVSGINSRGICLFRKGGKRKPIGTGGQSLGGDEGRKRVSTDAFDKHSVIVDCLKVDATFITTAFPSKTIDFQFCGCRTDKSVRSIYQPNGRSLA